VNHDRLLLFIIQYFNLSNDVHISAQIARITNVMNIIMVMRQKRI